LVSAVKLLAVPVFGVILVWLLTLIQLFNADMVLAFFVAFAMPTAGTSSILSDEYDGDTEGAVAYILSSTLLCVITIPILYWLVCMIV
jgi:predicted permease